MQNRPTVAKFTRLSLAVALLAGTASAQEAPAPLNLAAPPPVEEGPAKKQAEEEIVITGSRVRRKDLSTPAPVAVVSREQISASGVASLGDFLQQMPENTSSTNTNVNNGGDGQTTISLRNLGAARTLVLVDGKRYVNGGSGAGGSVDLNSIPSSAIERIEILKDGASAVYGTDAIGGVVNIITRRRVNGVEVSGYTGQSVKGDGQQSDLSLSGGVASDKGSFMFSAGYFDQNSMFASARDWANQALTFDYAKAASADPLVSATAVGKGGSSATPQGRFRLDPSKCSTQVCKDLLAKFGAGSKNYFFAGPGDATAVDGFRPYVGGTDAYNYQAVNYLITPSQRFQLFSNGDYKLADTIRAYFQGSLVNRQSSTKIAPEPLFTTNFGLTVAADNQYNPFGIPITDARRRLIESGGRGSGYDLNTVRTVVGVDGTLPEAFGPLRGLFFDLSFNYGRTSGYTTNTGAYNTQSLGYGIGSSYQDANGTWQCGRAATGPAGNNCTPVNLFGGPGTITKDMITALGAIDGTARGWTQIASAQANVSHELFKLMSEKSIGIAAGYEFRAEYGGFVPDPVGQSGLSTDYNGQPTKGRFHVNEGYVELSAPIASKMQGIDNLELSAALRAYNYNTFGSGSTYKFAGMYRPIRDVTVRGTYSTGFRAPGIGDLYGGQGPNFPSASDPCGKVDPKNTALLAQCKAGPGGVIAANNGDDSGQLQSTTGGNSGLSPETAKIGTLGIILEPQLAMLKGLSFTADFWTVTLDQTLGNIGTTVIVAGCYPASTGSASTPNAAYCSKITRSPLTGQITNVLDIEQNVGQAFTNGLDFALKYGMPTDFGRFAFAVDATYLLNLTQTLAPGSAGTAADPNKAKVIDGAGNYDLGLSPRWKANVGIQYGIQGFTANVRARYVGGSKECADANGANTSSTGCTDQNIDPATITATNAVGTAYVPHDIAGQVTFDLNLGYKLKNPLGVTTLSAGVRNLLNSNPPAIYNSFLTYADTQYDFAGRFVYMRLSQQF